MKSLLINHLHTVSQSAQKGASNMLTGKKVVPPVVIKAEEKGMLKMDLQMFANKGVSAEAPSFIEKGRLKMKKLTDQLKALKIVWAASRFEKAKEKGKKTEKIDMIKFKKELFFFDKIEREDLSMLLSGGLVAMVATQHHIFTGKPVHTLYYDGWFLRMSEGTQKFILAHELGHVIKGHTDGSRDNMTERFEFMKEGTAVQPIELEADAFAADEVGFEIAVDALKEIEKLVGTSEARDEIRLRIAALEEDKEKYLFVESLLKGGE